MAQYLIYASMLWLYFGIDNSPNPPSGLTERQLTAWFKKQNEKRAILDNVYKRNRHGETALHRAAIKVI